MASKQLQWRSFLKKKRGRRIINSASTSTQFHHPSTWVPPKCRNAAVENLIKRVSTDVDRQLGNFNKKCCHNDNQPHRMKALRDLQQHSDIVTKPADKGSAVMALCFKGKFIKETELQLNNHAYNETLMMTTP